MAKYCSPENCEDCLYLAQGDFVCIEHDYILVRENWKPTKDYKMCKPGIKKKELIALAFVLAFVIVYFCGVTVFQLASLQSSDASKAVSTPEAMSFIEEEDIPVETAA